MLSEAFKDVLANRRLAGVPQSFGDGRELSSVTAAPCLVWVPSQDRYGPPDSVGYVSDIFEGQMVIETSMALRKAGVDVHIFTPYTLDGYRQAEMLINALLYACRDEWGVNLNWSMGDAHWVRANQTERRDVWEVIQPLQVFVPIFDTAPAQLVGAATVKVQPADKRIP